jgi:hypothetical protein
MLKAISGYKILTLLSMVDGKSNANEDLVIRNWLIKTFQFSKNFDYELENLTNLPKKEYGIFLQQNMDAFYTNSTTDDRNNLIQFAINLIKADGKIVKGENVLFDQE